jgi:hypothetical protein
MKGYPSDVFRAALVSAAVGTISLTWDAFINDIVLLLSSLKTFP